MNAWELIEEIASGRLDVEDGLEDIYMNWLPLDEAELARIQQYVTGRPIGIITAFREEDEDTGEEISLEQNRYSNRDLLSDLQSTGFRGGIKLQGAYVETFGEPDAKPKREDVFLVQGKPGEGDRLKRALFRLGQDYKQNGVLFKDNASDTVLLIGTKNGVFPGHGVEHSVGQWEPQKVGMFYSRMKGKTFVFESIASGSRMSLMSRMGVHSELKRRGVHVPEKFKVGFSV